MDGTWHWPNLMEAFEKDALLLQAIDKAMHHRNLQPELFVWDDGGLVARVSVGEKGWSVCHEIDLSKKRLL